MRTIKPLPHLTIVERSDLLAKLQKNSVIERRSYRVADECWVYLGKWEDGKGFKKIKIKGRAYYVHRVGKYALTGEQIPEGLVLDHQCRVRGCWRPSHTDPVTTRVNTERGNGAWVYGQGAQTGRFSGAAPNGEGGCLGQQVARMDVYTHPEQFLPRTRVNESDPALTAAAPAPIVGKSWVTEREYVATMDPGTGEICMKEVQPAPPTFCERHKLEGWLPRNVERAVNWMRGRT